jgi:hypothetical protein
MGLECFNARLALYNIRCIATFMLSIRTVSGHMEIFLAFFIFLEIFTVHPYKIRFKLHNVSKISLENVYCSVACNNLKTVIVHESEYRLIISETRQYCSLGLHFLKDTDDINNIVSLLK